MEREVLDAKNGKAALLALGALAGQPRNNPHPHGRAFVILPQPDGGMKVEYLERPETPERRSGTLVAADTESFVALVGRYFDKDESVIYATLDPAGFVAVLNDHSRQRKNWRDHRVTFTLQTSKELEIWQKGQKAAMTQEELAFFIEDNLPDFKSPEGARMLEIALNFRAKQQISFKSGVRLQDGQVQFEYVEQNDGGGGASGKLSIPETFTIEIPVWAGLDARKHVFEGRLRYKLSSGTIAFRYELVRPHKVIERAFKETLDRVQKGVKDAPIVFGKP